MSRNLVKPPSPTRLVLTKRDKQILWRAHEFRFITTNQIERFTGSMSRSKLNMRLRDLWGADYLTRPAIQRDVYGYREKRETVHAIGQKGADWLSQEHGVRFPDGKGFEAANKIKSGTFLEHEVGVAETMLQFERDVAEHGGLRLILQPMVISMAQRQARTPFVQPLLYPTVARWPNGKREDVGTKPDYAFYLVDERNEAERKALIFLEYENTRKDATKLALKYLKYADLFRRKLHTERLGNRLFRVLFVIKDSDPSYRQLFLDLCNRYVGSNCPVGMFLHAQHDEVQHEGVLSSVWRDRAGDKRSLIA